MDKKILRKNMKNSRNNLETSKISEFSDAIINNIYEMDEYKNAKNIFCFVSFSSEVITHEFIKTSLKDGKNVFIPYIDEDKNIMKATKLKDFDDLKIGFYGILSLEDEKLEFVDPKIIDLIIVPGLIFDYNFYRIGYGGGYYDKFLSNNSINPVKIGVCFDMQLIDDTKPEVHDVPVDYIVTEKRVLRKEK